MLGHGAGPPVLGAAAEGAPAPHYGTAGGQLCPGGQPVTWLWSGISILVGPDLTPEAAGSKSESGARVCGCLGLLLSRRAVPVPLLLLLNLFFYFLICKET